MIVNRYAQFLVRLQFYWFVLCLSIPAYSSATKLLKAAGIGLAWYHHVGLAVLSPLMVAAAAILLGVILSLAFRIVRLVRLAYERRA